jgi:hypothetical protein
LHSERKKIQKRLQRRRGVKGGKKKASGGSFCKRAKRTERASQSVCTVKRGELGEGRTRNSLGGSEGKEKIDDRLLLVLLYE